jgi:hypothetical protein
MKYFLTSWNNRGLGLLVLSLCLSFPLLSRAEDLIHLGVSDKMIDSLFDMAIGAHLIPKTNVVLSRNIGPGDPKRFDKVLALDINGITRKVLLDQFKGKDPNGGFTLSGDSDGELLIINPRLLLNVSEDGLVTPWLIWNVEYWDLYWNKKKWEGYCSICLSKPKAMDGADGWTSNGGKSLEQAVENDARKLIELTEIDLKGGFKNKPFLSKRVKAAWLSDKEIKEEKVDYLDADAETILVKNLGEKEADNYAAANSLGFGLAGSLGVGLGEIASYTILFNGSLVLSNDFGYSAKEKLKPTTPQDTK